MTSTQMQEKKRRSSFPVDDQILWDEDNILLFECFFPYFQV